MNRYPLSAIRHTFQTASFTFMEHIPVLLEEVIQAADPKPGEFFVDGTIDGGGYAEKILERIGKNGILLGIDWDSEMAGRARNRFQREIHEGRARIQEGNFADISAILAREKLGRADGVVLDLGFSSAQLERSGRGFSFQKDEPLLMTYSNESKPAREILQELSEAELARMFRELGDERFAGRIAQAIKRRGNQKPIETSGELAAIVRGAVPKNYERGRIHPATRTFLALRIYANRENQNLKSVLGQIPKILKPGGRAAIVSFHSSEDRIIKKEFKNYEKVGRATIVTKKPISATRAETRRNPRARSAQLRALIVL